MENIEEYNRVLLYVENDRSVCAAEKSESRWSRIQIKTSLHS